MGLSTSAKVGIVTLVALTLLAMVIIWKTEIFQMRQGYILTGSFNSVEGLTIGSEVRFRGLKVGKVTEIDPGPYDIKIYAVIEPRVKIPSDSSLRVAYDGIVGLKYLEIKPGTSETIYAPSMVILGERTAAIVDFIDIGSKNLVETKAILETVRKLIGDPQLQQAFKDMVYTGAKAAADIEKLTMELRATNQGIQAIVSDPKFQANVKGTIAATDQTLSSANKFFENAGKVNMRASGGIDVGSRANAVRGDVDVIQSENTYYRIGFGEGPTRQPGLLDFLMTNKVDSKVNYRLGLINSQLGGGVVYKTSPKGDVLADIYDINNPRPNNPKVRVGYEHEIQDYMDLLLQADDILNANNSNFMFGVRVKSPGEKLF
jgi:phospholipid/cholesterol/gamma-HCH transport system substrate-binding protein